MHSDITLFGLVDGWPSKYKMAAIMRNAGLRPNVGNYSVRLADDEDFTFQEYGGDLGDPFIDAGASNFDTMLQDAGRVSAALAAAGIRHSFELYNDLDELVGDLHHEWPQDI